jgi:hypothetical protein
MERNKNCQLAEVLRGLDALGAGQAFESAKNYLESRIDLWDWEEDVEPMGVARQHAPLARFGQALGLHSA